MNKMLMRKPCTCGKPVVEGGECSECAVKRRTGLLQRAQIVPAAPQIAPPIVHEVLRSPGQPLDTGIRKLMEPQFQYDFSGVRIHRDSQAADSAKAVNARAYTVGQDVVFGEGEYAPSSTERRELITHELMHVIQQGREHGASATALAISTNRDAENAADITSKHIINRETVPSAAVKQPIALQRRAIRDDYATAAFETGPIWDVALVILNAPDTETEDLQTFKNAAMDGIRQAAWSFGTGSQYRNRSIHVTMSYTSKQEESAISQKAFNLARQSLQGSLIPTNREQLAAKPPTASQTTMPAKSPEQPNIQAKAPKMVSTLCYRDFQKVVPGSLARHCFVWGHTDAVKPDPANIIQTDTITFDNKTSGTPDPAPQKNTVCTNTFRVDPERVRENYKRLAKPENYNIGAFNCCTAAYLALSAAGASLRESDFPPENQGTGLPYGGGWKRNVSEIILGPASGPIGKDIVGQLRRYSDADILGVSLTMKREWIWRLIANYCTEAEGDLVIRLFKNNPVSDRRSLYEMVEGHPWTGNWRRGLTVRDDDIVDALTNKQLDTLKNIINAK